MCGVKIGNMRGIGKITKCMGQGLLNGLMGGDMRGNI
jgi:hypothetical protein